MMAGVLKKGENTSLFKRVAHLNEIIVSVKWIKKADDETEFDIDASAFLLTVDNKVRNDADFIFYNQPASPDHTVVLNNSQFKIALNSITHDIYKINFVLTLHDAKQKQQNFGMLEKITIELFNLADQQKLVSYSLDDMSFETALVLGLLYRYKAEWKFRAIGQGYKNGLAVLAKNFGVDVEEEDSSLPPGYNEIVSANKLVASSPLQNESEIELALEQNPKKLQAKKLKVQNLTAGNLENQALDIHNTDIMTKEEHYHPIVQWFEQRNFIAEVNPTAMDTSGFFDEVAVILGDNYDLLKIVSNTIKRRQTNKNTAYIELLNYTAHETGVIKNFCKQLYDYSFVAKYFYNQHEKKIVLHLQSATKIVNFFNGEWLEWYAFMKIATVCHQRKISFSCTRNMIVYLPDNNKYELDVFLLINDAPLFIECKSGEYREFIDKYSRLRKKLCIQKPYFLFLTLGVDNEHVKGLTAMFDMTFVNEKMLVDYFTATFLQQQLETESEFKPHFKLEP